MKESENTQCESSAIPSTDGLGVEPTYDDLNRLWTAAIECEGIGGSSMETLYALYEARMKKFSWVGKDECNLRFALNGYLEHRGYKRPISTEIEEE